MRELIEIEIAGLPPTLNQMYRTGHSSYRYKRPEVKEWQENIAELMRHQAKGETYSGLVSLHVLFQTPNRRRWDMDNRLKALQDCLSMAGIIKDDTQIWNVCLERRLGETAATFVKLFEMEGLRAFAEREV